MAEQSLARCPFCKGEDVYLFDTDFHDADGPLYWTVKCPDCDAHGPAVEMYDTKGWSDEQRKRLNKCRSGDSRLNTLSDVNRQRAIDLWNACSEDNGNDN